MYIGSGKTKDVLSGRYNGTVSSNEYRDIFKRIRKEKPHLIHSEVINQFTTREKAYEEEIKLHAKYDVARCPVFMNKAMATTTGFTTNGTTLSDETKAKISAALKGENNGLYGKTLSDETKAKISAALKGENNGLYGKTISDEQKQQISAANKGKKHSDASKAKMSLAKKGKPQQIITCPHCGKHGGGYAMKRYHFDNCKHLNIN
jgi:DNA-directed RNA polymerase subunit M/transcription elongation factor TFIIS